MPHKAADILPRFLLIFVCFTLTSAGYLAWIYHLATLVDASTVDVLSMVVGYTLQAAGIGVFAWIARRSPAVVNKSTAVGTLIVYLACLAPSIMGANLVGVVAFGLIMNVACGVIAGFYLNELACGVPQERRGVVFGCGYAAASVAGWLLSAIAGGVLAHTGYAMGTCLVLAAITMALFVKWPPAVKPHVSSNDEGTPTTSASRVENPRVLIVLAFATVFAMSLVKNLGFDFPTTDLQSGVSLELSRVFYAIGLAIAGVVCDRSRRYGAFCCLAALVVPFIMLALAGEPLSSMVFWCLGYLFFGFFSVYRVVLFCDIADSTHMPWLSGVGLLSGRLGDALGTLLFVLVGTERLTMLVILTAVLFVATMFLFFHLYQHLYSPSLAQPAKSEREVFEEFAASYNLSAREREVLRLLLDERPNTEIAAALFVSEATVKFHVHNLLSKTGCKNRLELLALYAGAKRD